MDIPGMCVVRPDTVTNARLKSYLVKDVLQVCNVDLFPTGNWEVSDSCHKSKRDYDVSAPGEAIDPERSLFESKRRAKSKVMDIALCNRFAYMFTWTLNGELIDRYDSEQVYKKVRIFLSNAVQRQDFRYVLIPEYHSLKDGETQAAIHMHGLCYLGAVPIERAYSKSGQAISDSSGRPVYNMTSWNWGFSTCVPLDDDYVKAVNYVSKYITKAETKIFGKWYLSSRSLTKSPDIIPLERMSFEEFRNSEKLALGVQSETVVFRDIKILCEEYRKNEKEIDL